MSYPSLRSATLAGMVESRWLLAVGALAGAVHCVPAAPPAPPVTTVIHELPGPRSIPEGPLSSFGSPDVVWTHTNYQLEAIEGDRLIASYIQSSAFESLVLYRFHPEDGRTLWSATIPGRGGNSLPVVIAESAVLVPLWHSLIALDIESGAVRWMVPYAGRKHVVRSVVGLAGGGAAVCVTGRLGVVTPSGQATWLEALGCERLARRGASLIVLHGRQLGRWAPTPLSSLATATLQTEWTSTVLAGSIAATTDLVIGLGTGEMTALDPHTGVARWQVPLPQLDTRPHMVSFGATRVGEQVFVTVDRQLIAVAGGRARWRVDELAGESGPRSGPTLAMPIGSLIATAHPVGGKGTLLTLRGGADGEVVRSIGFTSNLSGLARIGDDLIVSSGRVAQERVGRERFVLGHVGRVRTTPLAKAAPR